MVSKRQRKVLKTIDLVQLGCFKVRAGKSSIIEGALYIFAQVIRS